METASVLIAILGNNMVEGAEAGTALRVLFGRLATGNESAGDALRELGVSVRDSSGEMLPAVEIVGRLQAALQRFGTADQDRLRNALAGERGGRPLGILLREGAEGFNRVRDQMAGSLTVQEKFAMMTDTLQGGLKILWAHIQEVAVAIGESLVPAMRATGAVLLPVLKFLSHLIRSNQEVVKWIDGFAIALIAAGAALAVVGVTMWAVGAAVGVLAKMYAVATLGVGLWGFATMAWSAIATVAGATAAVAIAIWSAAYAVAAAVVSAGSAVIVAALTLAWAAAKLLWAGFIFVASGQLAYTVGTAIATVATWLYKAALVAISVITALLSANTWIFVAALVLYKVAAWAASAATFVYSLMMWKAAVATTAATGGLNLLAAAFAVLMAIVSIGLAAIFAAPFILLGVAIWEGIKSLKALGSAFTGFGDLLRGFGNAIAGGASGIATAFAGAWDATVVGFSAMFDTIVDVAGRSWQGIKDAISIGDWELTWEILKTSFLLIWEQVKAPLETMVNSWKDAFSDAFTAIWTTLRSLFTQGWLFVKLGFIRAFEAVLTAWGRVEETMAAAMDVIRSPDESAENRQLRADQRQVIRDIRARPLTAARRETEEAQYEAERAARRAGNWVFSDADTPQTARESEEEQARIRRERDDALRGGNEARIAELDSELGRLIHWAEEERMMRERETQDAARVRPQVPEGPGSGTAERARFSLAGGFSAGALFGALQGSSTAMETPLQRIARLLEESRREQQAANRIAENARRIAEEMARNILEIARVG